MIEISADPAQIWLDRRTDVTMRIAYRGSEFCTRVHFEIIMPEGFFLMSGSAKGTISRIEEGGYYDHPLCLISEKPGVSNLVVTRFSFRDEFGRVRRLPDYPVPLNVLKPPTPALELAVARMTLQAKAWHGLPVIVRNNGKGTANQIVIQLAGSDALAVKETSGIAVNQLQAGEAREVTFTVFFNKSGSRVPIDMVATCNDSTGKKHSFSRRHYLIVEDKASVTTIVNQTNIDRIDSSQIHTSSGDINVTSKQQRDEGASTSPG